MISAPKHEEESKSSSLLENTSSCFYIDAHTHIQDIPEVEFFLTLERAKTNNIKKIVVCGCCQNDYSKILEIIYAANPSLIVPFIGIHPWFTNTITSTWLSELENYLQLHKHASLGEIGLDFTTKHLGTKEIQLEIFIKQLDLGILFNRPITIHCVHAYGDLLKILKKHPSVKKLYKKKNYDRMNLLQESTFIMHSYTGSRDNIKSLLKLNSNFFFSFSLNQLNRKEVIEYVPIENLLLETDSPHQFSAGCLNLNKELGENLTINNILLNGRMCPMSEPSFVKSCYETVASIKKITVGSLCEIILKNSKKAFKIQLYELRFQIISTKLCKIKYTNIYKYINPMILIQKIVPVFLQLQFVLSQQPQHNASCN